MQNSSSQNTSNWSGAGSKSYIFIMIPVIYIIVFVIGILGNIVVVIVIYFYMSLKTVASIFLFNLALADIFFLITLPLWATSTAMHYKWPFGNALCKISAGITTLNLYASIFFLTCLSIDRYMAIVHPMASRQKRTLLFARIICFIVWVLAALISTPAIFMRKIVFLETTSITACAYSHPEIKFLIGMGLTKNIVGFLIPFLIILICYCLIVKTILEAYYIQQSKPRNDEVFKMIVAVVAAFFLCWIPHQVLTFLYVLSYAGVIHDYNIMENLEMAMPFSICIAYINSCLNPILYGYVGRNFRRHVTQLLKRVPSGSGHRPSLSTKMNSISLHTSETLIPPSKKTANACDLR
ncbi:type-1A angiotensin II receptor-like [Protopterus annectens]|uniref:type-1A angiotensin II receptor-like n=1 Tax=Protopterus annectens TaxID=7888 RepID=UPI001CF9DD35|nr:type-1A angiotensin II receptor-like [Protopterus annectens]XP_043926054.1 type-1A angiotensin II receptor-like [Protopterus annectens]XP_043926055.1 type-1A angiotensin II receptor-like [Protopterus annectens]XP_043926056.1 type-1A angiotensin II receptor-like [Protopterus annectens]XP_043926057.1 type-1A angiotensin II receptor-like [Protopterus annectens]